MSALTLETNGCHEEQVIKTTTDFTKPAVNSLNTRAIITDISSYNLLSAKPDDLPTRHLLRSLNPKDELKILVKIQYKDERKDFAIKALINSGVIGNFIHSKVVDQFHLPSIKLSEPISTYNADQTMNLIGEVTHQVQLKMTFGYHEEEIILYVLNLEKDDITLGHTWLKLHNPKINWKTDQVAICRCPPSCFKRKAIGKPKENQKRTFTTIDLKESSEDTSIIFPMKDVEEVEEDSLHMIRLLCRKNQIGQFEPVAITEDLKDKIPEDLHDYLLIFDKKAAARMPVKKLWDHEIELKEGFQPKRAKVYPLSPAERKEVEEWLKEHLEKGYIQESKSPQTSPVFFVPKKDETKRMVQDYRYLNTWTIRNAYPLPLILDLVDRLIGAKIVTKLDLRHGYNNLQILEQDRWKAAFATHQGSFEPTVIFYGMTNSPAVFQTMMNHLFRDLINRGVVVVYMDDILIFTKDMEEHNKVIEEVLTILKENNLFLKPEKCV